MNDTVPPTLTVQPRVLQIVAAYQSARAACRPFALDAIPAHEPGVPEAVPSRLASPDEVRRFRLEAEEASQLDHPNIVPIYHIGEHGGHHYFTMKLIEGGTLTAQAHGPGADLKTVARLTATMAQAVHYAHRHGIL